MLYVLIESMWPTVISCCNFPSLSHMNIAGWSQAEQLSRAGHIHGKTNGGQLWILRHWPLVTA